MSEPSFAGRCLCGAVTLQAAGPPKWTAWCHCQSCRRHTGAPASAFAGFERDKVTVTGEAFTRYPSSTGVLRGFCGRCGSTLSYEAERWPTEFHVHVGAFDDPEALAPGGEVFPEERLSWFPAVHG